jgi:hypothetical protein
VNYSLTGWPLILTVAGACFSPLIAASGVAYRQQAVPAAMAPAYRQQPRWQPMPARDTGNNLATRFREILNPGPMATTGAIALAQMAWYCLCCERDYRQQHLFPGESLAQQPCQTIDLACDETLSEGHRAGLLRLLAHQLQSHGLDNDPFAGAVMAGG